MKTLKEHITRAVNGTVNILWIGCIMIVIAFVLQVFVFSSFRIPSDSMSPELIEGDNVVVCKLTIGPRLFNIFASLRGEKTPVYRLPGFKEIERNDVLVFHHLHPNTWDKLEMHMMKYYIKRCIGLPGDTLLIQNGFYKIKGTDIQVGNREAQTHLSLRNKQTFEESVYITYPYDSIMQWNIKDFGPLYIPKANDKISMDRTSYHLYWKLIEWEQQKKLIYKDSLVYLGNQPISEYQFQKNYYFMGGDKADNSQDSRYWGLLPEDYIVGKAWLIWKSSDPYTETYHWKRFFKTID
ncbi:signal peptidase I [Parabacteroides chinchillae]